MFTCEDCGTAGLTSVEYDAHAGGMCDQATPSVHALTVRSLIANLRG